MSIDEDFAPMSPGSAGASRRSVIPLWPKGPPSRINGVGDESTFVVEEGVLQGASIVRNITEPILSVALPAPETANGRGVIVAPGGGWVVNAWSHEGLDVAQWLAAAGYAAFALKYRVQATDPDDAEFGARMATALTSLSSTVPAADKPRSTSDLPSTPAYEIARAVAAEDGRRAIQIVREGSEGFRVRPDRLGMIGFSAGAFMTVDIAMDPRADQLAWIAPIYGGETRGRPVPADAPPMFAAVAQDDLLAKIVQQLHAEWTAADRPAEFHHFASGGHGFGMIPQGLPCDRWIELLDSWVTTIA